MNRVRLLFAPENIGIAERIAAALVESGYDADANDGAAAVALVIWSPAAAASPAILSAARAALARRVLVPVALNKAPPPPSFEHLWPMDLAGWNGQIDDPRWRFVLDEIELAVRRGVDLVPAAAPAAENSGRAEAPAPAARSVLKKASRRAAREEPAPEDDIFADLPGYYSTSPRRPRPRVPRTAVVGAVVVAALVGSAAFLSLKPSVAPPQEDVAPPIIAFVEPKNQPADEATAVAGGDTPPIVAAVDTPDAQGETPDLQILPEANLTAPPESDAISTAEALRDGSPPPVINDPVTEDPVINDQIADQLLADAPETLGETQLASSETAAGLPPAPELIAPGLSAPDSAQSDEAAQPAPTAIAASAPAREQGDNDPIAELTWQATGAPEAVSLGLYLRDCIDCPDLAEIDPGVLTPDAGADSLAAPVMLRKRIAVAVRETTFDDWAVCVADGACAPHPDNGWGREKRPVMNVSWSEAQTYVQWLSAKTGKRYRLPSESEWEYAARAGSRAAFSFGQGVAPDKANYDASQPYQGPTGARRARTLPTASFAPNLFGLYDMHGNVAEWTGDCWSGEASGEAAAPTTVSSLCSARVVKGGGWDDSGADLRASSRKGEPEIARRSDLGFRVVRDLE